MRSNDFIAIAGRVGNAPDHHVSDSGVEVTTFRLASSQGKFDREKGEWVDTEPNWYSVSSFRRLAVNVSASVEKGDSVMVVGKLKVEKWETGEKKGTSVQIEADAVGLDLSFNTAARPRKSRSETQARPADDQAPDAGGGFLPPASDAEPIDWVAATPGGAGEEAPALTGA